MPSKKRKYNARFPAGRIKKIMQTDEEVGKVAQAVPIIISSPRTLELFVESLLGKALQVTVNRSAKTLSPSHVKQCILGESRFDFLRDLVKNIPDVSAAEEKELMSAESSPTSSRFSEASTQSNCDSKLHTSPPSTRDRELKRAVSAEIEIPNNTIIIEPLALTAPPLRTEPYFPIKTEPSSNMPEAIDLTKKPLRIANFYQETLVTEEVQQSVIKLNPTYSSAQPSTSYTSMNPVPALHRIEIPVPKPSFEKHSMSRTPTTPRTPITPLINIDFSKNLIPEIKVLDATSLPKEPAKVKHVSRQNSKSKIDVKKVEMKAILQSVPVDIDILNSGNLQIDEDYDT